MTAWRDPSLGDDQLEGEQPHQSLGHDAKTHVWGFSSKR
jgi:hypothetical protein